MDTHNRSKHPSSQGSLLTECITWCNIRPYLYFLKSYPEKSVVELLQSKTEQKAKWNMTTSRIVVVFGEIRSGVKSSNRENDPNTSVSLRWHIGKCGRAEAEVHWWGYESNTGACCPWEKWRVSRSSHTHPAVKRHDNTVSLDDL